VAAQRRSEFVARAGDPDAALTASESAFAGFLNRLLAS